MHDSIITCWIGGLFKELELCPGSPALLKAPLCPNSNKCLVRSLAWSPLVGVCVGGGGLGFGAGVSLMFGWVLQQFSPSTE